MGDRKVISEEEYHKLKNRSLVKSKEIKGFPL
jgi:hypothetical protein